MNEQILDRGLGATQPNKSKGERIVRRESCSCSLTRPLLNTLSKADSRHEADRTGKLVVRVRKQGSQDTELHLLEAVSMGGVSERL
jgi:hypothetical protein